MKYAYSFFTFLLIFNLAGPADLWAQGEQLEISVTAGSMRSSPDGTLFAEGGVVVTGQGVTVHADRLIYDPDSGSLMLSGNVVMKEDGGGSFTGDNLALDLSDLTGGISRGEIIIVPNGFRVRGEDITRTGPEEYSIRKGVFTSCPGECPDWSFTASRILVRKEGYLEARHAAFRIVGIPVFYTPYLLYPVKTKRQTGLLFPELGYSEQTGFESKWPLFITLGPHADATISPRTFSRDNLGVDLEARYRLDWGGGGEFSGFTMTGGDPDRWYLDASHAMALSPDLWLRGRWYDAGDDMTASLFGNTFEERYPGAVSRHATLEGEHGILGYRFQTSSLLTDGKLAGSGITGSTLNRDLGALRFGPGGTDLWRLGVEAESTRFEGGEGRVLVSPTLAVQVHGPWKLTGNLQGRGILATGGEGTREDEAYLFTLAERVAVESKGDWGRHRVDLEFTAHSAQGAAFATSGIRDGRDRVERRRVYDTRLTSLLVSLPFRWNLMAGTWQDPAIDESMVYGQTRLSYSGLFLETTWNQDSDFGLVLPSLSTDAGAMKGWQVEAGYESKAVGVTVGRDSAKGFPDMLRGQGHFTLAGVRFSGKTFYDLDAGGVADETLAVEIPGRCWTVAIGRSRSPDRTAWSLQLKLGL